MNQNIESANTGYLIIKVSTAQGAIPLSNATVNIRGMEPENSGILLSLVTNSDGQTVKVPLPAPSIDLSEAPGNIKPYSAYHIDVFKDGYVPLYFDNVPVFPSILSIQPAVMIPLPSGTSEKDFPPTPNNLVNESTNTL